MSRAKVSLSGLSGLNQPAFTTLLAGIFEHSPWVPERAWNHRPFNTIDELHECMVHVVNQASHAEKLALIIAHPQLAGNEAQAGTLTQASTQEQRGAGLDQCSSDELRRLRSLNTQYMEKFGFPFIIAVKGRGRYEIMDALESRLAYSPQTEFQTSLNEIAQIARFRLDAMITNDGNRHAAPDS